MNKKKTFRYFICVSVYFYFKESLFVNLLFSEKKKNQSKNNNNNNRRKLNSRGFK